MNGDQEDECYEAGATWCRFPLDNKLYDEVKYSVVSTKCILNFKVGEKRFIISGEDWCGNAYFDHYYTSIVFWQQKD